MNTRLYLNSCPVQNHESARYGRYAHGSEKESPIDRVGPANCPWVQRHHGPG
jgi:hypothetical protein